MPDRELLKVLQHCSAVSWTKPYIPSSIKCKLNSKCKTWILKKNQQSHHSMGWLVAALSGMQEEQVQSHGREGADQQDCVFVFAFLHINSLPCFCHWDCAWGQLSLWPEQAALPRCLSSRAPPTQHRVTLCCLGTLCSQLWLLTGPALAFCSKPGPSVPFTAHGSFPTAKAGDSSSLFCGPLCYTTHLQWWIPPEMYGNVYPCHECLTSNLRARDRRRTCLLWPKQRPGWQTISAL